jgi:hypothetical protein
MGAATTSTVADDDIVEEPKVVLGHPLLRAPRDIALDEAIGMARWALNQAQDMLHREHRDINDECLLLWASMLNERITSKNAKADARQWHLDTREELLERQRAAIDELDATSQEMLSDAMELYASAEVQGNTTIKE